MKQRAFKQIDVFGATALMGNPLAVVLDGTGLTSREMQHFAHWTNLSETTFLLPPTTAGADYRVRIFTPGDELPFAGHPTLGSCHAWLQAGGVPTVEDEIVQECGVGLVRLRRTGARLSFAAPPLKRSQPGAADLVQVTAALGVQPGQIVATQLLDNGPLWFSLLLDSPQTVLQLAPDHLALSKLGLKVGVAALRTAPAPDLLIARSNREARAFAGRNSAPAPQSDDAHDMEVRAFAAAVGVNEDPVTGSLNASLAQWLIGDGFLPNNYIAAQGSCLGRAGRIYVTQDDAGQVWVGGNAVTCIDGQLSL